MAGKKGADSLKDSVKALRAERDPSGRVATATKLLEELRVAELAVSQIRDTAIVRLHDDGHSYQEIAGIAGLTRARVAQVVQRARRSD